MKFRALSIVVLPLFGVVGCSQSNSGASGSAITMSVSKVAVMAGATQKVTVQGGVGPYSYSVSSGGVGGVISSSGESAATYQAPAMGAGKDTIVVKDAAGNQSSLTVGVTATVVYVGNEGSTTISSFQMDTTTGALTAVGTPADSGTGPGAIVVDPQGRYLYAANDTSNDIAAFSINQATGALTKIGTNLPTGVFPRVITMDPQSRWVYVANWMSNTISIFAIQSDGSLQAAGTVAQSTGNGPRGIAVDATGKNLYLVNKGWGNIYQYSINQTTGMLTYLNSANGPTSGGPTPIVISPNNKFVYVGDQNNNVIAEFGLDPNGVMSDLNPFTTSDTYPGGFAMNPAGSFLYSTDWTDAKIINYQANSSTGALSQVGSVPAGICPVADIVDPTGKFLMVADYCSGDVWSYNIDAITGNLSIISSSVLSGTGANTIATVNVVPQGVSPTAPGCTGPLCGGGVIGI